MIDWWTTLTPELKVFYGIGMISLMVVIVQMLMTLIGFDAEGLDGGFDVGDASSGIGLFSSQTLGAFFLGFGWMGVAAIKSRASVFVGENRRGQANRRGQTEDRRHQLQIRAKRQPSYKDSVSNAVALSG